MTSPTPARAYPSRYVGDLGRRTADRQAAIRAVGADPVDEAMALARSRAQAAIAAAAVSRIDRVDRHGPLDRLERRGRPRRSAARSTLGRVRDPLRVAVARSTGRRIERSSAASWSARTHRSGSAAAPGPVAARTARRAARRTRPSCVTVSPSSSRRMSPTASSSRSSRSPKPAPKSMPNASCSRSNQPPPRPRTARPPRQVVERRRQLGGQPGVAERVGDTSRPSRTRVVSGRRRPRASPSPRASGRPSRPRRTAGGRRPRASPSRRARPPGRRRAGPANRSAGSRTPPRTARRALSASSVDEEPEDRHRRRVRVGQDVRQLGRVDLVVRQTAARTRCPCTGTGRPSGGPADSPAARA